MTVSTVQIHTCNTHSIYTVSFFNTQITTTVTAAPFVVESWLSNNVYSNHHHSHHHSLLAGLDTEWRLNKQGNVAILQICVGLNCLIFQLFRAYHIPDMLRNFLADRRIMFAGVGIKGDVSKLFRDYGLKVENAVDLPPMAAKRYGVRELRQAGLKRLARDVLELEVPKSREITMSKWDSRFLCLEQVQYACVDAYVSLEIGKKLISWIE